MRTESGSAVVEVECRTIVSRSRLPEIELCANPYAGYAHGCAYCYARWVRFAPRPATGVRAKVNAAQVLERQLPRLRGTVVLSTLTDPYQPAEKRYRLTRSLLERLLGTTLGVSVLTKSDLVRRDLDLLTRFPRARLEAGMSLSPASEVARRTLEPGAPPLGRRVAALRELRAAGVRTFAFIAPILPGATVRDVDSLLDEIDGAVDRVLVDELNGPRRQLAPVLAAAPTSACPTARRETTGELAARILQRCAARGLPARRCR